MIDLIDCFVFSKTTGIMQYTVLCTHSSLYVYANKSKYCTVKKLVLHQYTSLTGCHSSYASSLVS